jgi:hypothetical protein
MMAFKLDLSELPISPHQYRMAGIAMMVGGFLLLLLGITFVIMTEGRRDAQANRVKLSAQECASKISTLGLTPNVSEKNIVIQQNDLSMGMQLLAASSQAASLCANWKLHSYCLGEACNPVGLSMTLQHEEPQ